MTLFASAISPRLVVGHRLAAATAAVVAVLGAAVVDAPWTMTETDAPLDSS